MLLIDPDKLHMFQIIKPIDPYRWPMMYAGISDETKRPMLIWDYYLQRVEEERARLKRFITNQ